MLYRIPPLPLLHGSRFRFLKMLNCSLKLVTATGITKPDNMAPKFGERIGSHRVAGPRTYLIDAIGYIERLRRVILCSYFATLPVSSLSRTCHVVFPCTVVSCVGL